MKNTLLFLALIFTLASCKTVTGVVTDEYGTPVKDAMISIDCAKTAVRSSASGHFSFRTRARGKKCTIRAWNPADPQTVTVVQEYTYKAGAVKLVLKVKE